MAIDDAGVRRAAAVAAGDIGAASKIWGGTPSTTTSSYPPRGTVISRTSRPNADGTFTIITVYADGNGGTYSETTISGTPTTSTTNTSDAQSAYDTLYNEFKQYGLESLIEPLKNMIKEGASGAALSLALQNTEAYKKRFSANQDRIKAGLRALSPAEYIGLEDQYQNIMRQYGLPESYWAKDSMGTQAGFNQLIGNDVSAAELNDRLIEGQQKVLNSNPEVLRALKQFYPGINNGDILGYVLDPKKALTDIKRKVAAAEIGGAALAQNLGTTVGSAEALAAAGITKQQAMQGYETIGGYLPTASKLSDIYGVQGVGPYDQATAEADVFGTAGSALAQAKRKKLTQLEQAAFSGQSGTSQGALSRDRALTNYMLGTPGAGSF